MFKNKLPCSKFFNDTIDYILSLTRISGIYFFKAWKKTYDGSKK